MNSKRVAAFFLLTLVCLAAYPQSFVGYGYDNYSGVNSMILNPATIADSRYKVHVNLFAVSGLVGNNAYEMDQSRLFSLKFSNLQQGNGYYKSTNADYKYLYTNIDILGPSAMISLTSKDAVGLSTRLRVMGNEYNLGDPLFRLLGDADPTYYNTNIENRSLQVKANAFAETGASYGRVLFRDDHAEMKLGVTGKYIFGLAYGSMSTGGPLILNLDPTHNIVNLQADVIAQYSANLDNAGTGMSIRDIINKRAGRGMGFDAGIVYELKARNDPSVEKFRVGLSVTDIGSITYTNSLNSTEYTLAANGSNAQQFQQQSGESIDAYFTRLKTAGLIVAKGVPASTKVSLPTAVHFNIDYEIYKRIYINADALINMVSTTTPMSPNYVTTLTATPRLEKKWVSVYSPVSYNANGQLNWGAGVRIGPLFIGSGSVLSCLLKNRLQTADAHAGLTIPIFQHTNRNKKPTLADTVYRDKKLMDDRDGDGVVDSKDQCPDSAGPIPLFGCPDDDGDGVPNNKDKCPGVKGSPNYQGCPAPDTDGDSVNDDDDKCPLVKGDKNNYGCPAISSELVNKVNRAADRVFFVRAKATIEAVSFNELDRVADILKSDSTLRLRIEGHTDSEGPDAREVKLSLRRAQAVGRYLVIQGINPSRLEYVGFGKKKPIAPNDSPEGMARNRRVDMILMNYPGGKKNK